jgi:hypothetical protein
VRRSKNPLSSQAPHFIIMNDLERFVRPPFGSGSSQVGTLDPFDHQFTDVSYGPTVLPIDDSLSVVSIDGPPSMTDDDDDATGAVFRREGGALQNDDDDVDSEILSWMASPDFDIDESHNTNNNAFAAAGGSNDDERSNIEAPQEHDVRFGRGRTYPFVYSTVGWLHCFVSPQVRLCLLPCIDSRL